MVVILVSIIVIFLVSKWLKMVIFLASFIFGWLCFWWLYFRSYIFGQKKVILLVVIFLVVILLELYFPRPSNFLSQIFLLACYDYLSNFEL